MRITLFLSLFISSICFAYPVGHYIGFGSGYTWTQADFNDKIRTSGILEEVPSYSDVENSNLPWYGYLGFRYHPNYGIELGYMDYGTIEFAKTLTTREENAVTSTSVRDAEITSQGFYIQHVLSYSVFERLVLQARAGVILGSTHYSDIETLTTISEDTGSLTIVQPNSSSDGFIKAQLSASALYKTQSKWYWKLQLNQIEIDHDDEQESFSQWFTSLALEYPL